MLTTSSKVISPLCLTGRVQIHDFNVSYDSRVKMSIITVLLLLSVTWGLLQGLDDQGRGGRYDGHGRLAVLNRQRDSDLQTFPVLGGFGNVFTNLLGRLQSTTNVSIECLLLLLTSSLLTRPNGPILGASEDVAPISPPTARRWTAHQI